MTSSGQVTSQPVIRSKKNKTASVNLVLQKVMERLYPREQGEGATRALKRDLQHSKETR